MLLGVAMDFYVIAFTRGGTPAVPALLSTTTWGSLTPPRSLTPRPRAKASRRAMGKEGPGSTLTGSSQ